MTPNVVIYHEDLLTYSEIFILNQAEALTHFRPYYVGTRRVESIPTPVKRTIVLNNGDAAGRLTELWHKVTGLSRHLESKVRALQPQLIHAHFGLDRAMALPLARRLRLPLVVTFQGSDATMHDEHLLASRSLPNHRLVTKRPQLSTTVAVSGRRATVVDAGDDTVGLVPDGDAIEPSAVNGAPQALQIQPTQGKPI